ncbi:diacylglycerol kinase [Streptomyces bambusae]|uniref:Diacylglycerol kinase n=1 Tax=Streptomyces bambusae TaxID=1550616 RepID=A0ABS6ZBZ8_9ACTN|nr:diacylglycerol kinase [Streptomyces bambusae]MBW5485294.1 diacylglycerol kinase [Streptomyces bambusae]
MSEAGAPAGALLLLVDPVARRLDGESVRIAKDVLCAGAAAKICLPETPEEFARALARRGHRRPVVVGDDRALVRAVSLLHRSRELGGSAVSLIPVGAVGSLVLARSLGVPAGAVAAARAVLDGAARTHDLLVDDSDGVVLGGLRIPPVGGGRGGAGGSATSAATADSSASPSASASASADVSSGASSGASAAASGATGASGASVPGVRSGSAVPAVWSACRSLVRTLVRPPVGGGPGAVHRLRVEADGVLLVDVDQPVTDVSVTARDGLAEVVVRGAFDGPPRLARARAVTVTGPDFRYHADHAVAGPVRRRTWTLRPGAWQLTVPRS